MGTSTSTSTQCGDRDTHPASFLTQGWGHPSSIPQLPPSIPPVSLQHPSAPPSISPASPQYLPASHQYLPNILQHPPVSPQHPPAPPQHPPSISPASPSISPASSSMSPASPPAQGPVPSRGAMSHLEESKSCHPAAPALLILTAEQLQPLHTAPHLVGLRGETRAITGPLLAGRDPSAGEGTVPSAPQPGRDTPTLMQKPNSVGVP